MPFQTTLIAMGIAEEKGYSKGLEGIVAGETTLSLVDGEQGDATRCQT